MRIRTYAITAALLAIASVGYAQAFDPIGTPMFGTPYGGLGLYRGYWKSTTAGEGFGHGLADVISSLGQANVDLSTAAINYSQARRNEILNNKLWTQVYFEMRDINRQHREAEYRRARGNPEDAFRYSAIGRPKPLGSQLDPNTGEIRWPMLLTLYDFAAQRARLQKAFADRAYHGVMGVEDYMIVRQLTGEMLASLSDRVADLPPQQYMTAKRFLESLAHAASQPAG
ncbi:MAG: hypothetical protein LLG00_01650 [Planctomycetaceae bacterium]|nr:hypothetical protein [Planctomycetaceae bacterium]